jgi:hypothetical protein
LTTQCTGCFYCYLFAGVACVSLDGRLNNGVYGGTGSGVWKAE